MRVRRQDAPQLLVSYPLPLPSERHCNACAVANGCLCCGQRVQHINRTAAPTFTPAPVLVLISAVNGKTITTPADAFPGVTRSSIIQLAKRA